MRKAILCIFWLAMVLRGHGAEGFIQAGQLRVHYTSAGAGDALVLLHAGYQDLYMWDSQVEFFTKYYTVIRMDLPGHGDTRGVDTTLRVADVIRIVLDSLHIRKAAVLGLSMGASCATDFTLTYPERVSKLVVVSPGLSGWPLVMKMDTMSRRLFHQMDSLKAAGDFTSFAEGFVSIWCVGPYRKASDVDEETRNYIYGTTLRNHAPDDGWPVFDTNYAAPRLKEIKCPVLILRGDADIPFIIQVTDYYKQQLPRAKLAHFKLLAHMVNMEKPDIFNWMVYGWLKHG